MGELKRWCLSQLQNLEVRLTEDPSGTKLRVSSSAAGGLDEDEGAVLAVLPHSRGAQQGQGELSKAEPGAASHHLVVHVESLPGKLIHVTCFNTFLSIPLQRLQLFSGYNRCLDQKYCSLLY